MPSDNLEKYIKENVEAVQHTPPPGVNWDPEVAWLKMQQPPVLTRRKKINPFSYAAAILIFALFAGLVRQYFIAEQPRTEILVATKPAKKILTPVNSTEITAEKPAKHQADDIAPAVKSGELQPKIAWGKKMERAVKSPALSDASTKIKNAPVEVVVSTPDAKSAAVAGEPEAIAETATPAETSAQPLKITVVLGKTSMAKMLNQTANNNLPAKKRKTRLRLNVPVPEPIDKGHLATTDSAYQPLKLQARIDL